MLSSILNTLNDKIQIRSLALGHNGRTKTAIIELNENFELSSSQHSFTIPGEFLEQDPLNEDDDHIPKEHNLTIDDHFLGLTVLRSIPDPVQHQIE